MWQFVIGFSLGIYVGTYYNCKPQLNNIIKIIKKNLPDPKDKP